MSANFAISFNEIYNTFYRKSYLFVKSYVHDDMAAEDIVSEALIKLWERMKWESIDPINFYLFTVLKNQSLDYLRHQAIIRDAHSVISNSLKRELAIRTNLLEASDPKDFFSSEVRQIIESTLKSLPERTREIFRMRHFENKSHKEISDLFHISVKGVDYHISQSVKALKVSLKDYLPFLCAFAFLN